MQCSDAVYFIANLNGANPCDNSHTSLMRALEFVDCCQKENRYDLAEYHMLQMEDRPLGREEPIASLIAYRRMRVARVASPSLVIRGWNFTVAMTRWVIAGRPRRSQTEIDERLAICQECPFLENNICTKCGCACVEENQIMNKLVLATEVCPEGRWK